MNSTTASHELPLSLLSRGESGVIARLAGTEEVRRKLSEQGMVPGARVYLVHADSAANLVVRVGETRLALGRSAAARVFMRIGV